MPDLPFGWRKASNLGYSGPALDAYTEYGGLVTHDGETRHAIPLGLVATLLREAGWAVFAPGSSVPALVEAALAWIRDECVCVHYTNSEEGERTRQTLNLETAARKLAREGEK